MDVAWADRASRPSWRSVTTLWRGSTVMIGDVDILVSRGLPDGESDATRKGRGHFRVRSLRARLSDTCFAASHRDSDSGLVL